MTKIGDIKFTVRFKDGTTKRLTAAEIAELTVAYEVLDSRGNVLIKNGGGVS